MSDANLAIFFCWILICIFAGCWWYIEHRRVKKFEQDIRDDFWANNGGMELVKEALAKEWLLKEGEE